MSPSGCAPFLSQHPNLKSQNECNKSRFSQATSPVCDEREADDKKKYLLFGMATLDFMEI